MSKGIKILSILVILAVGGVVAGVAILKSLDFNEYRGLIAEQVKAATGRDLTISGPLNLEISLSPAVAVEGVTFANASWGTAKEMANLKRLAAEVELLPLLSGDIRIKRVVLEGLDLLVETDSKGRGNWEIAASKPQTPEKPSASGKLPVVQKVRIKDLNLTYLDGRTGEKTSLKLDHLDLQSESAAAPMTVGVGGAYNDLVFKADGRLGPIKTLIDGGAPYPVTLTMSVPGLSLDVEGAIAEPRQGRGLDFKVSVDGGDIAAVAKAAGVTLPKIPPVRVSGRLKDPKGGYSIDNLVATIGDIDLRGRVGVKLAGVARPSLDADITTASTIDLDALLPKQKKPAPAPKDRVFPDDPLPLDGLKAVDAKVKLAVKRVVQNAIAVDDIKLSLSLSSGRLDVKSLKAVVNGGTVDGGLVVDGSRAPSALAVNLNVRGSDYGALLQQLKLTDIATGKVDITLNVKGQGASVRAIMAGLNGQARIVSQGGKIDSGLLNIVSSDISAALPFIKSKGDKEIRCAVVDFKIKSGQANAKTLVFETGGMSMLGTGGINLKDETLALRVDPRAKKVSLLKIAMLPINIGGTLAAPTVLPDMGGAVVGAVTGAVSTAKDIASGGLSAVGNLVGVGGDKATVDDTDYCKPALAGRSVSRVESQSKTTSSPSPAQSSSPPPVTNVEKMDKKLDDIGKSIGGSLKGLFGK
ncbi:MAG: AsmA family protein [Alphaproteobacteria bacterium]|jgi:AsmA family protein|nr:AsmA family protein [Alphaproteobacteria bacterium]